ncbi:hypothetical protein [Aureibaculum luteum]|uniref:hypothetical protein n=1 Tax=Aureibaculum luteum TaxID=1548456 RepID=UPI000E54BC05|nr:hypothetical protein [Aureibaculum luteum]
MTNKEKGILVKLRRKARSNSQKCYNPDCENVAIRSHIQQKEGSIREIASGDGEVIQLENIYPYIKDNRRYDFKEKGIKQKGDVLTFWGFCNECDNKIFEEIESKNVDLSLNRNQLLFSYRGFLSELYKQEYNLKWYKLIFESNELTNEIKQTFYHLNSGFDLATKFGRFNKQLFESDLIKGTNSFEFIHFALPKIEICTSTSFSSASKIKFKKDLLERKSLPPIVSSNFINLIPQKDKLNVILGCHSEKKLKGKFDLDKISNYNEKEKIKLISDVLIRHVETWFVSKNLYNKWKDQKKDVEILNQIHKYLPSHMKSKYVKFNMFQDHN